MKSGWDRFVRFFLVASIFAVLAGCSTEPGSTTRAGSPGPSYPPLSYYTSNTNQWTIMVYLDADNDLAPEAVLNFNQMLSGLSKTNVKVIVLYSNGAGQGGTNWSGSRLYLLGYDPKNSVSFGERVSGTINGTYLSDTAENPMINMANTNTLSSFVDWAKINFPSQNTMLVLWDHGSGWKKFSPSRWNKGIKATTGFSASQRSIISTASKGGTHGNRAIIEADSFGTQVMMNYQVRQALAGRGLTILGFDACLMSMAEVAYEFKDTAQYMVGSEDEEPGDGWDYSGFLSRLCASPLQVSDCYKAAVDAYANYYTLNNTWATTLSAIDLSQASNLVLALNTYTSDLSNFLWNPGYTNEVFVINNLVEQYIDPIDGFFNIDIWDLADKLPLPSSGALKSAVTSAVVYEWHSPYGDIFSGDPNSHGIALYFETFTDQNWDFGLDATYVTNQNQFNTISTWPSYLMDMTQFPPFTWIGTNQSVGSSIEDGGDALYQVYVSSPGTFTVNMKPPADCNDDLYLVYYSASVNTEYGYPILCNNYQTLVAQSTITTNGAAESISYSAANPGWYVLAVHRASETSISMTNEQFSLVVSNVSAVLR